MTEPVTSSFSHDPPVGMASSSMASGHDPSVPGAGAQRVVGITQLYFRVTNSAPLTVVVVDALCLVFGADGATVAELAGYLALSESAVRAALDGVPQDMRCTSADLEDATTPGDATNAKSGRAVEDPYYDGDEDDVGEGAAGAARGETRYYLNYRRILSVAYAHLSHMLLALCVSPLPPSAYTERIRRTQLEAVARASDVPVEDDNAVEGLMSNTLNLSPALRKKEALEGIYCPGCQFYFALTDFAKSASRCPTCQQDVLRLLLLAIKARLDSFFVHDGRSLVVTPQAQGSSITKEPRPAKEAGVPAPPFRPESKPQGIDCPLARDPFLVQQALAFLFLYSTPFACLSDARCVTDPDDILTEPEYENRLRGRASVADEFRARHRNASRVRVRIVSQKQVDAALREENARKIAKRANLPPWLTHKTTLAVLAAREKGTTASPVAPGTEASHFDVRLAGGEGEPGTLPGTVDDTAKDTAASGSPAIATNASAKGRKRAREGKSKSAAEAAEEARRHLTSQARFVAAEFFEDDFDVVALPRYM